MTANQLLDRRVSQLDYQRGKASALPPDELYPGELYRARLLLREVARRRATEIGVYAVDTLVKIENVYADGHLFFAEIRYVSEDGQPEDPVYEPRLTGDGIIKGRAAPLPTKEGYLLHPTGDLEDELDELVKEILVPIRVVGTSAIPVEQPLIYQ